MKTGSGPFFVDSNVLVYAAMAGDPRHSVSKELLMDPSAGVLHISPQILTEFYSTVTSPKRVAEPYLPLEAIGFLETLLGYEHVVMLAITPDVAGRLLELLRNRDI
jgi:predicted nucleic acid-binding protein